MQCCNAQGPQSPDIALVGMSGLPVSRLDVHNAEFHNLHQSIQ